MNKALPKYKCHKEVSALKIKEVKTHASKTGVLILVPDDETYEEFEKDRFFVSKHQPHAGGYYIVYADGYQSFSPAKAFDSGYSKI